MRYIPMIFSIIFLVLFFAAIGVGIYAFFVIRKKAREFSTVAFGNEDIIKNLKTVEEVSEKTAKSVSDGTNIYAPKLVRDFPEFSVGAMTARAQNCLREYLLAINNMDSSILQDGNEELREALFLRINDLNMRDIREHYEGLKIHRTVLNTYNKYSGRCVVRFQSAVEYRFWAEKDGKVIKGNKDSVTQTRYIIDCCYIQDSDKINNIAAAGHALTCPNCGGVIKNLGEKICPYCGAGVVEFNIRVWNFCDIKENG